MTRPLSCFFIGSDTLLVQCAEIWREAGHEVRGVVTADARLVLWCEANAIPVVAPGASLAAHLRAQPAFDYLFAVTWLDLLDAEVLAVATHGAINFHDGPLPRYAGLNATSWALLAEETDYAITWHTITAGIDAGEILWQEPVAIAADDTALTLNARCFEAAMRSFRPLVGQLADGSVQRRTQDSGRRTYFGRAKRPPAAGLLDWREPRASLVALVRGLDFGGYRNPLLRPKVLVGHGFVSPRAASLPEATLSGAPGTILQIEGETLLVQAGDGPVALTSFTDLDGRVRPLAELAATHGLRAGAALPAATPELRARLTEVTKAAAPHEATWVARLAQLDPAPAPYAEPPEAGALPAFRSIGVELADLGGADAAVAAALAFVARCGGRSRVDVAFRDPAVGAAVAGVEAVFVTHLPLSVAFEPTRPFADAQARVVSALAAVRKQGAYPRDLVARYPELEAAGHGVAQRALPIRIELVTALDRAPAPADCQLAVQIDADGRRVRLGFDTAVLSQEQGERLARQFTVFVAALVAAPARALREQPLMAEAERQRVLYEWNATTRAVPDECIHDQFRRQAKRTPDAVAVRSRGRTLTYAELDQRSDRLAAHLRELGVVADARVGVYLARSVDLPVALLGILKAGGAYVPLDPAYPADRLQFMAEDAGLVAAVVDRTHAGTFPAVRVPRVVVDDEAIPGGGGSPPAAGVTPAHLAYVIYTSGSTGKPKGVMVQHGNVVNFFAGMDDRLGTQPGVWLAVTSLSFDISVLELLWTLTRGFAVVIHAGHEGQDASSPAMPVAAAARPVAFSLFYFASDEGEGVADKYDLLLQGARFADEHGFEAVWTPERHFHAFGGLYPNPSVASAAIAAVTRRVGIRSGSVVLPLHHPIRIAEEWALVDNLSRGRVGISFAAGWQPNDFVLQPANFADRKKVMFDGIETVKRLWRGDAVTFPGPRGDVEVRTLPRPVQRELAVWVTIAGNPETYVEAGRAGARVLTHLLGQSVAELGEKLALYRSAWRAAGHAGQPYVTLMLHTFVGDDDAAVKATVRGPMREYLRSAMDLVKRAAWSFPTFKDKVAGSGQSMDQVFASGLSPDEVEALLDHAFERYYETSGLFGTPETCMAMVRQLQELEVDEIACLIDFGVPSAEALAHLQQLLQLRQRAEAAVAAAQATLASDDASIPALLERHHVTHFQCTPSMMTMLLVDPRSAPAIGKLAKVMVGGEALPAPLARELHGICRGDVLNMYGPTETTIWSTVGAVTPAAIDGGGARIGRPIANTQIYVLDANLDPTPTGVAGELWIGGLGVVRGYHARPELTAERFRKDPFLPDSRIYRTGDLAAWREDGTLQFFGRIDHQVKVRGYRIELGEIEAALTAQGSVREAVVVAREDTPGDKRLVAYVVPAQAGKRCDTDALRAHLRTALPEFMVPAHVVQLERLPLTPNKKIDRNALPAPGAVEHVRTTPFVAAEGEIEATIADIWKLALGADQVGANDNFFDLGGHSLLAVKVHRDVQAALGREFSITALFQFPTVATLAASLAGPDGPSKRVQESGQRGEARRALLAARGRGRRT